MDKKNMTTREVADMCGVTEQTIRRWCVRNNVPKVRNAESKEHYELTDEIISDIMEYSRLNWPITTSSKSNVPNNTNHCEQVIPNRNSEIELLKNQVKQLLEQINTKDEHISMLMQQLVAKDNQISILQQSQIDITSALTSAQALHAGTIQQQLTDTSESDIGSEQKRSWLSKLLHKKF